MAVNVNNGTSLGSVVVLPLKGEKGDGVSEMQSQINLLQSEINQLIAPTGTAPTPDEIINARIGADGITYESLGDAIRSVNVMRYNTRDSSTTSSKMLKKIGCYNINTSSYTDLTADFGGSKIGALIVFGNPVNSQLYHILYLENGALYARWVHKTSDTAGAWHPVYTDISEVIAYRYKDVETSDLLNTIGYYNINSSWYTDLQSIFGNNLVCTMIVFGHSTNKKIQLLCTEDGCMYLRGVTSGGTADPWKVIHQNFPYIKDGKYIAFGDSRCYGLLASLGGQSAYRYPKFIADAKSMAYQNEAISGSGLFADDTHDAALTTIQNTDISDATLITIEYGVNDWEHPIGLYTDTNDTTFCGKLYRVIKYITETNPNATLIVIGSANTAEGVQASSWGYGYTTPSGWSLGALIDEEAKLCAKYHVPFISGYDDPFNDFNISSLMPDDIHFADQGYLMRSQYLLGKINALYASH